MSAPRDELDALRAAWQNLEVPEGLGDSDDPETRACVGWMVNAWDALEPDGATTARPSVGQVPTGSARRLRAQLALRALPFAAAACAILMLELRRSAPAPQPVGLVELAQAEPIRPLILADGSIETRSGKVRLILLPEITSSPDSAAAERGTLPPRASAPGRTITEPSMENSR